jgi:hypothetical protein
MSHYIVIFTVYDHNHGEVWSYNSDVYKVRKRAEQREEDMTEEIKKDIFKMYSMNPNEDEEYYEENFDVESKICELNVD